MVAAFFAYIAYQPVNAKTFFFILHFGNFFLDYGMYV